MHFLWIGRLVYMKLSSDWELISVKDMNGWAMVSKIFEENHSWELLYFIYFATRIVKVILIKTYYVMYH